jgi:hypothetical protein
MIDLESQSQAMRLKKCGNSRFARDVSDNVLYRNLSNIAHVVL